jgi:Domain of unknown function (DUF4335)
MPLSNSVLHRYTPPTCTLQVVAYSSPVSRWVGSKVVKELQFDLWFDDPRIPTDGQLSIKGDRNQLEALHTVVTNYIQEILNLSPENFAALGQETPATTPAPPVDVESDVWLMPADEQPPTTPEVGRVPIETIAQGEFFALKPATKVTHNLFLGSLATPDTGQFISLSILQLFDLATALDEYARDLIALPAAPSKVKNSSAPLAWVNIAAVLLVGVGVTAVGLQMFNRPNSPPQTANNVNNSPKPINSPQIALAPTPLPTLSPAGTLVPPPTTNIVPLPSGAKTPTANSLPTKSPLPQTITPGSKTIPVPNNLPPQPIVVNPNTGQPTTTVTIPGQVNNRTGSPIVINPNPGATLRSTAAKTTTPVLRDRNIQSREDLPQPKTPSNTTATRTAFVPNPQVAEVSNYFNQRWEPPTSLRSSLEYSIVLDVDGSIQVIEPYGLASRNYLDRTGMPLIGERFVSANQNGQSPRIRLRFNPNGKVQAFLEAGDAR